MQLDEQQLNVEVGCIEITQHIYVAICMTCIIECVCVCLCLCVSVYTCVCVLAVKVNNDTWVHVYVVCICTCPCYSRGLLRSVMSYLKN